MRYSFQVNTHVYKQCFFLRCYVIPSLIQRGFLLPSNVRVEELEARGFKKPFIQAVSFWDPLILWIQGKNKQFIAMLIDAILKHEEDANYGHKAKRFVTKLISAQISYLKRVSIDSGLARKILKHCLYDPGSESNQVILTVAKVNHLCKTTQTTLKAFLNVSVLCKDAFTYCSSSSEQNISFSDNERLLEYFETMPVGSVDLSRLRPAFRNTEIDYRGAKSWSPAAGPSWLEIQGGVPLNCFEILPGLEVTKSLAKLPDNINADVEEMKRRSSISEFCCDAVCNEVSSAAVCAPNDTEDTEQMLVDQTSRSDRDETFDPETVVLF